MENKKKHLMKIGEATRFSSENQPEKRGRKGKSTTEYLREIGQLKDVSYCIKLTDKNGKETIRKGKIESESSVNELMAVLLVVDAIKGNHKARKEYLDRTEGKSRQSVELNARVEKFGFMTPEERNQRMQELKEKLSKINVSDGKEK